MRVTNRRKRKAKIVSIKQKLEFVENGREAKRQNKPIVNRAKEPGQIF